MLCQFCAKSIGFHQGPSDVKPGSLGAQLSERATMAPDDAQWSPLGTSPENPGVGGSIPSLLTSSVFLLDGVLNPT